MYLRFTHNSITVRRNEQGAFLILICSVMFLLILIVLASFYIWKLFFQYQNSQSVVDSAALRAAEVLNQNDCIGKINNMTVLSRELVFDTRASYNATLSNNNFYLEPLGRQLLNQARVGSSIVDQGRKQLIIARLDQVHKLLKSDDGLNNFRAELVDLQVGGSEDSRSNVFDDSADEIQDFDKSKKFIDPKTKRFAGNINAKLPEEDDDLTFKLSPLRGVVDGQVQQAALLADERFVKTAQLVLNGEKVRKVECDQMPSAVKMQFAFPTDNEIAKNSGKSILVSATALTHGGQPLP